MGYQDALRKAMGSKYIDPKDLPQVPGGPLRCTKCALRQRARGQRCRCRTQQPLGPQPPLLG